tara:strand:+ start:182 stop:340 length:159 start_codon:yes stop_codon:yes gene_type:complete
MSENERPYLEIPLPPPEWIEYHQRLKEEDEKRKNKESEKSIDIDGNVIIIDI